MFLLSFLKGAAERICELLLALVVASAALPSFMGLIWVFSAHGYMESASLFPSQLLWRFMVRCLF